MAEASAALAAVGVTVVDLVALAAGVVEAEAPREAGSAGRKERI